MKTHNLECPGTLVVLMKFGSHLYGLDTPTSDIDYKGVYIPTLDDILAGKNHHTYNRSTGSDDSKNSSDDVDIEWISLAKFASMIARGEVIAVDMLHATKDVTLDKSSLWDLLVKYKEFAYAQDLVGYNGYVKRQAHKYGIKGSRLKLAEDLQSKLQTLYDLHGNDCKVGSIGLESVEYVDVQPDRVILFDKTFMNNTPIKDMLKSVTKMVDSYGDRAELARNNEGVDWKAMSHAIRVSLQIDSIYKTGSFSFPFTGQDKEYLLNVKKGLIDFKAVSQMLEMLVDKNREASKGYKPATDLTKEMLFSLVNNAVKSSIKDEIL